jgi:hypothetical protein
VLAINPSSLLEYKLPGSFNIVTVRLVINTRSHFAMLHVRLCSHLWNSNLLDETPRAWTLTEELDICKKNPGKKYQMALRNQQVTNFSG